MFPDDSMCIETCISVSFNINIKVITQCFFVGRVLWAGYWQCAEWTAYKGGP